jgi:hypothetical protein
MNEEKKAKTKSPLINIIFLEKTMINIPLSWHARTSVSEQIPSKRR